MVAGGTAHGYGTITGINCVSRGAPAPVYKGAREGSAGLEERCARRSPTPTGSRTPPLFHVGLGEKGGRGGGEEGRGGAPPPSPCPIQTKGGRRAAPLGCPFLLSTKSHDGPYGSRGVPVTSRYSGKIPISPGTLPISKPRLPIYQSLCLDHFETPRHVCDHIRDSEQPSVHQNA